MKKVFGLTGGIACGKSTVARILEEHGATVIDADLLARDVVAPGTPGLTAVIDRFGGEFLNGDALDRDKLGALVFADDRARADLNAILHPLIAQASAIAIATAMAQPGDPILYDAALLVENGAHKNFAGTIVVACDPREQLRRIIERDGLDPKSAQQRIDSQMPIADKVAVADHVIWNDGSLEALEERVVDLLKLLREAPDA